MLSIFSCVCQPSVCLLWRNVCLGLLPNFDWVICFSFSDTSLCIIGPRFIHLIRTDSNQMHSFLWLSNILLYICTTASLSIHLSMDIQVASMSQLQLFHVKSAATNTEVHVFFSVMVFSGKRPSNGIIESYGTFTPSFLRNFHAVLLSGCINLHSHQQCKRVLFFPHPLQHLLFVDFF